MNLAIFGGSGVVGRALIPELLARGHRIRALQHHTPLPPADIEVVEGGMTDPATAARVIEGADVVLQLTKGGEGPRQVVETSTAGTVTILDALVKAGHVKQYLLASSDAATGIWAHPHDRPVNHLTPPMSYGGYYSLGKVLEEVIAREYHRNEGVCCTVARLSYVQQEDSILRQFVAGYNPKQPNRGPFDANYTPEQKHRLQARERFVVMPCDRQGTPLGRTMVQREDVIDALVRMTGSPEAFGQVFHISGPGFRYEQPCAYLAERMGLPVERVVLPSAHAFDIDCSHTTRQIGWTPKFDILAMLDAALAWRESNRSGSGA